jgi:PAS domain S-box-containing protein
MRPFQSPAGWGYVVAVGATGLSLLSRWALDPALGARQPYCTAYLAIAATAWVGGARPALVALVLSAVAGNWFFVEPRGAFGLQSPGELAALVTFLAVGLVVVWLIQRANDAVAENVRLTDAFRHQADELRTLLDALPVGVFIADDPECRSIRANPVGRALLGLPPDANASKTAPGADQLPFRVVRNGVEVADDDLPMQRVARTGTPAIGEELDVVRADGSAVHLYEHVVPLFNAAGRVRGCVAAFVDVTDLRHAERQRQETQNLLRLITDNLPVLVSYVGADRQYRLVNQTYERWFGHSPQAIHGRPVSEVLGEAAYQAIRPYMDRALAGETLTFEQTLPYKAGGARSVRVTYTPDRTADGQVHGFVTLVEDVTDRQRAENAVRQSEARFRALMEQSPLSIQVFAPDGRTVRVNRAWEELWGVRLEQAVDYNVLHDRQLEEKGIAPFIRKGFGGEATAIPAIEYDPNQSIPDRTRHKDPRRCVRAFIYPLRDDHGRISEVVLIHEDITAQRRAEEELQGTAARLSFALSAAGMGDWFWDAATDEVRLSDRAAEMFGIPTRPPRTRSAMRELLHPDDRPRVVAELERVLAERADYDIEYRVAVAGGGWRWVAAKGRALYDPAGVVIGISGIALDVTERKQMDQELRHTVDALRQADRLKDEFLAMLAHELRNPLAPIRNALDVLKQPRADAGVRDQVRATAERQVGHMARLLDDLLDVSRISRGRIQLRTEPVDLAALAARSADAVRPLVEEHGHGLAIIGPPAPLWVEGDATRLEQVATNLLTNAAKYTDPGGRIDLVVESADGSAVLRVRDTGVGIAPDVLPRVFDLFVQAERRLDRARGGVGIGLTLVKRLVELHGGTVEAHSPGVGRGSEFVIRLPLLREDGQPLKMDPSEAHTPLTRPQPERSRRILVVDDNRDAADSLSLLLRLDGHEVTVAYDGKGALAAAPACRPDVVFLDLGMPGMDGYEVCRRLRQMPELNGVRLVALTGWGQEGDRRRSAEAGFDHHVVKPADPEDLRRVF